MDHAMPGRGTTSSADPGRPGPPTPSWRALVDRCRAGDEGAWEDFFDSFTRFAHRRLRRQFQSLSLNDRMDLASATLERLVEIVRGGRIRGETDVEVGAYLGRALRNQALDLISRRRPEMSLDDGGRDLPVSDGAGYHRVLMHKVMEIVQSWTPAERFIFLQKWHGVPSERVKADVEREPYREFIEIATIDTRYLRLKARLRSQLEC